MVHDRGWVCCAGQPHRLWNPTADVFSVGIELLCLYRGIEDPEVRSGIRSAARDPLPAERIVRQIRIHQGVPKPSCAFLPTDQQMLHQERSHHHTHPVVHPACAPQLPHTGIHQWVPSLTSLPRLEEFRVRLPRECSEFGAERLAGRLRKMEQQVIRKLAPYNLPEEGIARRGGPRSRDGAPDLPRADLAEVQVGGKPRCAGHVGPVPIRRIIRHGFVKESLQMAPGSRFAGLPHAAKPAGPIEGRLQLKLRKRQRVGPTSGRRKEFRRVFRGRRDRPAHAGTPERRE